MLAQTLEWIIPAFTSQFTSHVQSVEVWPIAGDVACLCPSVCLLVTTVGSAKTAELTKMLFVT